jgi:GDP-4-dehydro-6-deoxy-D-mannose reductase
MRALVTGIVGFAGSFLARELLNNGYTVHGTQLPGESRERLHGILNRLSISNLDLTDPVRTSRLVKRLKPDVIFHLGAISAIGYSFEHPRRTLEVNVMGTLNLLEAVRPLKSLRKILIVTSADIYGKVKTGDLPIRETHPLRPITPYGVSKASSDMLAFQYHKSYGLPVVRIRAFNHTGPKQNQGFVVPDFCAQVAELEVADARPQIRVGNLEAERDISDVRDIVRGYRQLCEQGKPGEVYNLCSGRSHKIRWILEYLLSLASVDIVVGRNPSLMRPSDEPRLVGSYAKAKRHAGFRPQFELERTLSDTLEYWRSKVRRRNT